MSNELIRPIDQQTAKAIEEAAKFGTRALESTDKLGSYAAGVLGRLPHNLIGIVDDWVLHHRIRNYAKLQNKTDEILQRRGVSERVEPSPTIAVPLLEAAIEESREELADLWARLLAAAVDPKRTQLVRQSLISVLKQMDPLDALVLEKLWEMQGTALTPNGRDFLASMLGYLPEDILVSFSNLKRLECISGAEVNPVMAPLGRVLLRAVRD